MTLMKCGCVAQGVVRSIKGVPIDPPAPACVVHDCCEPADAKPDLTGRMAKCSYRHDNPSPRQELGKSPVPSSFDLAFFEYRGPGSRRATDYCVCGYHRKPHDANEGRCPPRPLSGKRSPTGRFQEHGPEEFDQFYCGCFGWD